MQINTNNTELLNEILAIPSGQVIENRFVSTEETNNNAPCNGNCGSGACRSFV